MDDPGWDWKPGDLGWDTDPSSDGFLLFGGSSSSKLLISEIRIFLPLKIDLVDVISSNTKYNGIHESKRYPEKSGNTSNIQFLVFKNDYNRVGKWWINTSETIKQNVDRLKQIVDRLKQIVDRLKQIVDRLKQIVDRVKQIVDRVKQIVDRLKQIKLEKRRYFLQY